MPCPCESHHCHVSFLQFRLMQSTSECRDIRDDRGGPHLQTLAPCRHTAWLVASFSHVLTVTTISQRLFLVSVVFVLLHHLHRLLFMKVKRRHCIKKNNGNKSASGMPAHFLLKHGLTRAPLGLFRPLPLTGEGLRAPPPPCYLTN